MGTRRVPAAMVAAGYCPRGQRVRPADRMADRARCRRDGMLGAVGAACLVTAVRRSITGLKPTRLSPRLVSENEREQSRQGIRRSVGGDAELLGGQVESVHP